MRFSPPLDGRIVGAVRNMDVERMPIAEVWRRAGAAAERFELCRPGYHSILSLVLDERERRRARREAILDAVAELWAYTGPDTAKLVERLSATRRR